METDLLVDTQCQDAVQTIATSGHLVASDLVEDPHNTISNLDGQHLNNPVSVINREEVTMGPHEPAPGSPGTGIEYVVPLPENQGSGCVDKLSVLLLGGTGVGKSSFIAKMTASAVKVGHSLRACTTECQGWDFVYSPNLIINLIDTPGFNDTTRPDMDILESIVKYIGNEALPPIAGIIYLHRITDKRMAGSSLVNLKMLKALSGEHFFRNVALTTTMWDTFPESRLQSFEARETELMEGFWADMLIRGTSSARYLGTFHSGREIIDTLLRQQYVMLQKQNPPSMEIIIELRGGTKLEDTSAGKIITEELRKREEKRRQEQEEEEQEEEQERRQLEAQIEEVKRPVRQEERVQHDQALAYGPSWAVQKPRERAIELSYDTRPDGQNRRRHSNDIHSENWARQPGRDDQQQPLAVFRANLTWAINKFNPHR